VKFQDGEKKVLRFDTTKAPVRGESKIYTGKINWEFVVYDTQLSEFDAKTWTANKETAKKVVAELKKGYTVLEIERDGSGRDTRYRVRPVS
jgi:hypothetical protein